MLLSMVSLMAFGASPSVNRLVRISRYPRAPTAINLGIGRGDDV